MEYDWSYLKQRSELLTSTLSWIVEKQQIGIQLSDLEAYLNLGTWEVQHLFQEYLGKEPLQLVNDLFSNRLFQTEQPAQFSLFDAEDEKEKRIPMLSCNEMVQLHGMSHEPQRIAYASYPFFLGELFIASTDEGICQVTFNDSEDGLKALQKNYKNAELVEEENILQLSCYSVLSAYFLGEKPENPIPIVVKGSLFQLRVWKELIKVKPGTLINYGSIADELGDPDAARAVGSAVGSNPVALLIPCHRVINRSGKLGNFRWKSQRKHWLLAIEK